VIGTGAKVLAALAFLHLCSVAGFIWADLGQDSPSRTSIVLRLYKNLSGTFRDYTFFAPSVSSGLGAAFLVESPSDKQSELVNFASDDREISFRYNCIVTSCMRDLRSRELFAQSWSALILGSRPDANTVTVMVHAMDLPSMAEYRAGKRPAWKPVYAGTFGRRERPASR
jgi:hypothetical protein